MKKSEISYKIKEKAKELGFSNCGIIKARNLLEEEIHFKIWLEKGYNADMKYLHENFEKRMNPLKLVENTKSIIVLLFNYCPLNYESKSKYKISKYALSNDYHKVIETKLNKLLEFINSELQFVKGKAFVDSSPVLEKAIAKRANLGWIGKNSLLVTKKGSFYFISEIFVDIELEYNEIQSKDFCGTCTKCIDSCPTNAIYENHKVDANKCISYHTIENKGEIPEQLKGKFQNWIYGCDICQDVCPWNSKIEPKLEANKKIIDMTNEQWEKLDEEKFNEIFSKSSVKRLKFKRLKRNIDFNKS